MSVRTRLLAGLIIQLIILVLIIVGIVWATGAAEHNDDQVRFSLQRLSDAEAVAKNVGLEMDKADDLLASGGMNYEKIDYNRKVQGGFLVWEKALRDNINLSGDSSLGLRQKNSLARVEALRKTYSNIASQVDEAVAASNAGNYGKALASASVADTAYTTTFLPGLEAAITSEQANAAAADAQSKSATRTARIVPLVLAPIGIAAIALISILLMRDITQSITALKNGALRLGAGDLDVVIDTGRDDEFKQVADAFNSMAADLKRTTDELRQYAHTVSHDLKGPLTSVMLSSSLLAEELKENSLLTDEGMPLTELATIITDNVGKATDLVDDLLHLAEAGQFPSEVEEIQVSEVVQQVLFERQGELNRRGVAVNAPADLGSLQASHAQIYQVFTNLISNALKYDTASSPVIYISYLGDDEGGARIYQVRDNGPGVDPEDIDRLFDPFFKGEGGGTGIGLATVKKLVELYGGSIAVRNDNGAVFDFTLNDWKQPEG
jgi:signal transduction histidine kinase